MQYLVAYLLKYYEKNPMRALRASGRIKELKVIGGSANFDVYEQIFNYWFRKYWGRIC